MRSYTHIAGSIIFTLVILFVLNIPVSALYIFLAGAVAVIPDLLDYMFMEKHKRETHNIWILLILIPLCLVNQIFIIITAAYFSHLVLDLITYNGIRLLYPLKETKFVCMGEKSRIRTGTNKEKALFSFLCILMVAGILLSYQVFSMIDASTANQLGTSDNNTTLNQSAGKTNINVQLQVDPDTVNKNMTIKTGQNESKIEITGG